MSPITETGGDVAPRRVDARQKLTEDLWQISERLRLIANAYQEKPSAIDEDLLPAAGRESDMEATVTRVYRAMNDYVYAEDSPFRADEDLWEALREQKDEFSYFYKSALMSMETYRKVLRAYNKLYGEIGQRPRHGDLERIRQDEHVQVKERAECIEAVSNLEDKFTATLTVLSDSQV